MSVNWRMLIFKIFLILPSGRNTLLILLHTSFKIFQTNAVSPAITSAAAAANGIALWDHSGRCSKEWGCPVWQWVSSSKNGFQTKIADRWCTDVYAPQTWHQCRFLIHPNVPWNFTSPEIRKHLKTSGNNGKCNTELNCKSCWAESSSRKISKGHVDFEASIPKGFWARSLQRSGKTWCFWQCLAVLGDFSLAFTMLSPNCWALQSGSQDMLLGEVSTLVTARHSAVSFKP